MTTRRFLVRREPIASLFARLLFSTSLLCLVLATGCNDELPCPTGYTRCGDGCVDLARDLDNCGRCELACTAGQACVKGECRLVCTGDQVLCGSECVDVKTDPAHCGTCDISCVSGEVCVVGKCEATCPEPFKMCGEECVAVKSDPKNCGDCEVVCAADQTCNDGACACVAGLTECSGKCVNTVSDPTNCGGCGTVCRSGEICAAGKCGARCGDPPMMECNQSCVDTSSDPKHCGGCDTVCQNNQLCLAGKCGCQSPFLRCPDSEAGVCVSRDNPNNCGDCDTRCKVDEHEMCNCEASGCQCTNTCPEDKPTDCGGTCTSTKSDPANCGNCGNACRADQQCSDASCACPSGKSECSGACVDLKTDDRNCGACGRACGESQLCSSGQCVEATVVGIAVTCAKYELRLGEGTQCTAAAALSNGRSKDVTASSSTTWSTGDPGILEARNGASSKGQIVARGIGTTFVRALWQEGGQIRQDQKNVKVVNNCLTEVEIVAPHPPDHALPGVIGLKWRFYLRGHYGNGTSAILRPDMAQTAVWDSDDTHLLSFAASFGNNNKRDGIAYVVNVNRQTTVRAHWHENGVGCDPRQEFDATPVAVSVRKSEDLEGVELDPTRRDEVAVGAAACFRVLAAYDDDYKIDVSDAQGWGFPASMDGYAPIDAPEDPNAPANRPHLKVNDNPFGDDPAGGRVLCAPVGTPSVQQACAAQSRNFFWYGKDDGSRPEVCVFTHNTTDLATSDTQRGQIKAGIPTVGTGSETKTARIDVSGATAVSCSVVTIPMTGVTIIPTGTTQQFGMDIGMSDGKVVDWRHPAYPALIARAIWNSSNPNTLSVDGSGLGTAVMAGTARVSATLIDIPCQTAVDMRVADALVRDLVVVQAWHGTEEYLVGPFDGSFTGGEYRCGRQQYYDALYGGNGRVVAAGMTGTGRPFAQEGFEHLYRYWYGLLPNENGFSLRYRAITVSLIGAPGVADSKCFAEDVTESSNWSLVAPVTFNPAINYGNQPDRGGITVSNATGQKGVVTTVVDDSKQCRLDGLRAQYREYVSANNVVVEVCGKKDRVSDPTSEYLIALPLTLPTNGGAFFQPGVFPAGRTAAVALAFGRELQVIAMVRINNFSASVMCYHARAQAGPKNIYYLDVTEDSTWEKLPESAINITVGNENSESKGLVSGVAEGSDGSARATYEGTRSSNQVPFSVQGKRIVEVISVSPPAATLYGVRPRAAEPATGSCTSPCRPDGQRWLGEYQQYVAHVRFSDGTEGDVNEGANLAWYVVKDTDPIPDPNQAPPASSHALYLQIQRSDGLAQVTKYGTSSTETVKVVAFLLNDAGTLVRGRASAEATIKEGVLADQDADPTKTGLFLTTQDRSCYHPAPEAVELVKSSDPGHAGHVTTVKLHGCLRFSRPPGVVTDIDRFYRHPKNKWQSLNTACIRPLEATPGDPNSAGGEFFPVATAPSPDGCAASLQARFDEGSAHLVAYMEAKVTDHFVHKLELSSVRNPAHAAMADGCDGAGAELCLLALRPYDPNHQTTDPLRLWAVLDGATGPRVEVTSSRCLSFGSSDPGILAVDNLLDGANYRQPGFLRVASGSGTTSVTVQGGNGDPLGGCDLGGLAIGAGEWQVTVADRPLALFAVSSDKTTVSSGEVVKLTAQAEADFGGGRMVVDVSNDASCGLYDGMLGMAVFSAQGRPFESTANSAATDDPNDVFAPALRNCIAVARTVESAITVGPRASYRGGVPVAALPITVNP